VRLARVVRDGAVGLVCRPYEFCQAAACIGQGRRWRERRNLQTRWGQQAHVDPRPKNILALFARPRPRCEALGAAESVGRVLYSLATLQREFVWRARLAAASALRI